MEVAHGLPIELPIAGRVAYYKQRYIGLRPCERGEAKAKKEK
jgi:hypothetical protein